MATRDHFEADVDPFLLAEFRQIADSFLKSEEMGEKRVSFFITITTAVIGGVVTLLSRPEYRDNYTLFLSVFVVLLLFGLLVLKRMIKRGIASDDYIRALSRLRRYFIDKNPSIVPYLFFPGHDTKARRYSFIPENGKTWDILGRDGGLIETVNYLNSIIFGIIIFLLSSIFLAKYAILFSFYGVITGWSLQLYYIQRRFKNVYTALKVHFPNDEL